MLENLKRQLREGEADEFISESIAQSSRGLDSIKNSFMDDFETDLIGAEKDKTIEKLIESIPEYEDHDEEIEAQVNSGTVLEQAIEALTN